MNRGALPLVAAALAAVSALGPGLYLFGPPVAPGSESPYRAVIVWVPLWSPVLSSAGILLAKRAPSTPLAALSVAVGVLGLLGSGFIWFIALAGWLAGI